VAQRPLEPVGISPRVDCVFHAVLADPRHLDRLVDFLDAVLQRTAPVVSVTLRPPIPAAEFIGDGQIVLDVVATDAAGEVFQVEMQSRNHAALKERMLYAWATLYKSQLGQCDKYEVLRPVVAIGLLDENSFRAATGFHHRFRLRDDTGNLELSSHLEVHVLELDRWRRKPDPGAPAGLTGWMRFFTEAEDWIEVPAEIATPVLESAMAGLAEYKDNAERNNFAALAWTSSGCRTR
jgi:predicted transposase/invertase (TIGR01784 family)